MVTSFFVKGLGFNLNLPDTEYLDEPVPGVNDFIVKAVASAQFNISLNQQTKTSYPSYRGRC